MGDEDPLWRKRLPPPPKSDAPSVLLLRALGDLLLDEELESIDDMDALAIMSGIVYVELPAIIQAAIAADYVEEDDDGSIGLTKRGWAWFTWDLEKHRGGAWG